jgi:hypothetical protein
MKKLIWLLGLTGSLGYAQIAGAITSNTSTSSRSTVSGVNPHSPSGTYTGLLYAQTQPVSTPTSVGVTAGNPAGTQATSTQTGTSSTGPTRSSSSSGTSTTSGTSGISSSRSTTSPLLSSLRSTIVGVNPHSSGYTFTPEPLNNNYNPHGGRNGSGSSTGPVVPPKKPTVKVADTGSTAGLLGMALAGTAFAQRKIGSRKNKAKS